MHMSKNHRSPWLPATPTWQVLVVVLLLELTGCGGGGGSQSPPPPPPVPDFSLTVNPTSQAVDAGNSASVSLSASAHGGFSSQISIQLTGVPQGISVSPTSITLVPGTPQQVMFSAPADADNATATVTFTGTSGSLTHTASLGLSVNSSSKTPPVRTRYVRTDSATEYFQWVNQHWIVYHAGTARYFVTDPISNQVIVVDGASQTKLGTIGVPGAYGIDDTPDHSTLYVGTLIGDVYAIDPVGMTVKHRYLSSEIGPDGYAAQSALGLADGRLALLGEQGGIPSIDGSNSIAVWSPTDNSITIYGYNGIPLPCGPMLHNIGGFARSVDRTQILLGSIDSDGTLCEVNEFTGQGNYITPNFGTFVYDIVTSPDGKYIIQPSINEAGANGAIIYDANTLNVLATINTNGWASDFVVSADSTTLYFTAAQTGTTIIYAYDIATQQMVGWVPNIDIQPTGGGMGFGPVENPYLLATDGTGLFAGPAEEGIGFIDLSNLQTGPVGTGFTNGFLNPATGPTSGGTATQWENLNRAVSLQSIYFDSRQATAISADSNYIHATSPSGWAGPADVYTFTPDGGMQLLPEAFSYGPTILEVTPNMATAEGGGTGYIYGYGFGPLNSNRAPSDLKVTVGGVAAQVTAFFAIAYPGEAPFPLQSVAYTIPAGATGLAADMTVTTSSGTTTAGGALTYLPPIQQFLLSASTLAQGIYDPYRDLYYFTDASEIQVFSRAQGKWLSPIAIPALPGTTQRLWGIALSPDGSKLAVSDPGADALYLVDPANPTSVRTFPIGPNLTEPSAIAISDVGKVYFEVNAGNDGLFNLDTNTGTLTNYHLEAVGSNNLYLRNAITSDNSRVLFNNDGCVFSVETATDKVLYPAGCSFGNYELSLSSNQAQFTANFYLYDSALNLESYYAMNDREILNISYVYGAKLSFDGRLLFQPSPNGIDVFDGELGNLRDRISLPVSLSPNYDALVDDGTDNILIAITGTGNGIAVIDMTSVKEPPRLPYESNLASPQHGGRWREDSNLRKHPAQPERRPATHPRTVPHVTRPLARLAR
jgi:hypothetical protein